MCCTRPRDSTNKKVGKEKPNSHITYKVVGRWRNLSNRFDIDLWSHSTYPKTQVFSYLGVGERVDHEKRTIFFWAPKMQANERDGNTDLVRAPKTQANRRNENTDLVMQPVAILAQGMPQDSLYLGVTVMLAGTKGKKDKHSRKRSPQSALAQEIASSFEIAHNDPESYQYTPSKSEGNLVKKLFSEEKSKRQPIALLAWK